MELNEDIEGGVFLYSSQTCPPRTAGIRPSNNNCTGIRLFQYRPTVGDGTRCICRDNRQSGYS
jgi:hypothetical protein